MISSSGTRHGFVFSFSQLVAGVQLLQLGTQNQTWRCVFGILGRKQTTFSAAYTGFDILDTVDRNMEYGDQEYYDLHDTNVVDSNDSYNDYYDYGQ